MLIVRRKPGESLVIGDGVEVVILECGAGKRVKLGIIGPPEVNVYRKELAITQRQNRLAAADVTDAQRLAPVLSRFGRGCSRREIDMVRPIRVGSAKKY
ncbi:MAG TPA: carbon storage regulator [Bryobacteraceae bacterium]|jgi:carbon storage regulator|nr:carbon storage regulator [Bryobacteraceae bacterium]